MFPQYTSLFQSAGFVNVEAHEEPTPIWPWPKNKRLKEIGVFFLHQFIEAAVDGYSLALSTRFGGLTEEETEVLLGHVRKEIKAIRCMSIHICTSAASIMNDFALLPWGFPQKTMRSSLSTDRQAQSFAQPHAVSPFGCRLFVP